MDLDTHLVYCITNLVNDKKYVGKTSLKLKDRWNTHLSYARCHDKTPLQRAIRKYGEVNFTIKVLERFPTSQSAYDAEDNWIERMQARITQHGYNCRRGGLGGELHSEETRLKLSLSHKGIKQSEDTISKRFAKVKAEKEVIIQQAVELNSKGLTNAQISQLVGRCPSQVKEYLDQLNIQSHGKAGRNKQTRINEIGADIIRLREMGWSYRKIGKELKSAKKTVARIYQDYINWKSGGSRELPWDIRKYGDKVVELRAEGLTWREVCEEIGCGECTAIKLFNQMTGRKYRTQEEISRESERKGIVAKWLKSEEFCNEDIAIIISSSRESVRRYLK